MGGPVRLHDVGDRTLEKKRRQYHQLDHSAFHDCSLPRRLGRGIACLLPMPDPAITFNFTRWVIAIAATIIAFPSLYEQRFGDPCRLLYRYIIISRNVPAACSILLTVRIEDVASHEAHPSECREMVTDWHLVFFSGSPLKNAR